MATKCTTRSSQRHLSSDYDWQTLPSITLEELPDYEAGLHSQSRPPKLEKSQDQTPKRQPSRRAQAPLQTSRPRNSPNFTSSRRQTHSKSRSWSCSSNSLQFSITHNPPALITHLPASTRPPSRSGGHDRTTTNYLPTALATHTLQVSPNFSLTYLWQNFVLATR